MSVGLRRQDIDRLLADLDAELVSRGTRADLFLVGGAAIAVAFDARRATRDLDAAFEPTTAVREAAAAVAARHDLDEGWLNDAVKGFLPGPDPDAQRYFAGQALNVDVASARYLLAMKLFASRVEAGCAPDLSSGGCGFKSRCWLKKPLVNGHCRGERVSRDRRRPSVAPALERGRRQRLRRRARR